MTPPLHWLFAQIQICIFYRPRVDPPPAADQECPAHGTPPAEVLHPSLLGHLRRGPDKCWIVQMARVQPPLPLSGPANSGLE